MDGDAINGFGEVNGGNGSTAGRVVNKSDRFKVFI